MEKTALLETIKTAIREGNYLYSLHAVDQSILRGISRNEIEEAIATGEIIENYPDDKYGPSCLIYGTTNKNRALHIVCALPNKLRKKVKIITLYQPDPEEWIDLKQRRSK